MTGDGRFVVFGSSADNLVPLDTNNQTDIFIRDRDPSDEHLPSRRARGHAGHDRRDARITTGVTATRFDPDGNVRRDQMASFLIRMIDFIDEA